MRGDTKLSGPPGPVVQDVARGGGRPFVRLLAVASRYGALAAQFLIVVTVARTLPKWESGVYLLIFSAVTTTIVFVGFGAPDGMVKAVPELRQRGDDGAVRRQVSRTAALTAVLGAALLTVLVLLALAAGYPSARVAEFALWWVPYATLFFCGQAVVALGRPALGTFVFYALNNLVTIAVLLPYLLLAVAPDVGGALHVSIAAGWTAAAAGVATVAASLPAKGARPVAAAVPDTLRLGFVIAVSRLFQGALYWVPAWVAAIALGAADAAVIGAAGRLLIAVTAVIAVFRFTIRPRIVAARARNDRAAIEAMSRVAATLSVAFTLGCSIAVLALGRPAVSLVFGAGFGQAAGILAVLLVGALGESVGGPVDEVLKYSGEALFVLAALIVAVALEFVLAMALAYTTHSLAAVAAAQSVAFCAMYAAQIRRCARRLGIVVLPYVKIAPFRAAYRLDVAPR